MLSRSICEAKLSPNVLLVLQHLPSLEENTERVLASEQLPPLRSASEEANSEPWRTREGYISWAARKVGPQDGGLDEVIKEMEDTGKESSAKVSRELFGAHLLSHLTFLFFSRLF
jgi:hypothetical protein